MAGEGRHELRQQEGHESANSRESAISHELTGPAARRGAARHSHSVFAFLAVLLLAGLGIAIATQVKTTGSGDALDSASPGDLLVVLDTVTRREAALRQQISELEQTLSELQQGGGAGAALEQARTRLDSLSVQVGTVAATGPGVTLSVTDPHRGVGGDVILDLIQELRAAGAEAIEVRDDRGNAQRVGVDSWVGGTGGNVEIDGQLMTAPYTVLAIGDPPTLAAALNIPGGVVDHVARSGGRVEIEQTEQLDVVALREIKPRQYAQPSN
ncbi:MAG: DUF881 domain-containing protein [Rhodococcus sp.]|nr:DUF881 domain-containing protein [Rhodococcus sp. (in: high G+C Gram-positive bacteria)]